MAAAVEPLLMTVEQYRQLPDRQDAVPELHWGEVVLLTRPKMKRAKLQSRLVRLLRPRAEHLGVVEMEVAFRALPEYDLRGADVAFVSQERCDSTEDDDNLHGVAGIGDRSVVAIKHSGRNPRKGDALSKYWRRGVLDCRSEAKERNGYAPQGRQPHL
jgi:hypothetical protein